MKKIITYCSFIASALVLLLTACLFLIKLDLIEFCQFKNDNGSLMLIVDKKANQFIVNKSVSECILYIDDNQYKAHLTYNQNIGKYYQYWLSIYLDEDIPETDGLIKCNFGKQILMNHLISFS